MENFTSLVTAAGATELTLAAFLSIASAGICYRFFRTAPIWARMTSFLSILIMTFLLSIVLIGPRNKTAPIDDVAMIKLLGAFPEKQRMEKCVILMLAEKCSVLVKAIEGLGTEPASVEVRAEVTSALKTGRVSKKLVESASEQSRASSSRVFSLGAKNGYDIDLFWCADKQAARHLALANKLATAISKEAALAPGFPVGRVRVRSITQNMKDSAQYVEHGMTIGAESDEQELGNVLAEFLNVQTGLDDFSVLEVGFIPTPYYLSVFVCPNASS